MKRSKREIAMASPRAFVSFDFDHDRDAKVLFAGQGRKNSPSSFVVHDWSSKSHLPQAQWERIIEDKIKSCNMLIVLVGNNMGSATGVVKEIGFAKGNNVPVFGVYVSGAGTSSTLPAGLARSRVIRWNWANIGSAITQMMKEGKNR